VPHETAPIMVSDLQLDTANARLGDEPSSQQAVYNTLASQQGKRLITLARDIVTNGLDPSTLPVVVPTGDRRRRYVVLEGNRRILAIKALETPAILSSALGPAEQKTLAALSVSFHADPIDEVTCVIFDNEEEARHWIEMRHTGANDGAGLVEWDANELDRWKARHGGGIRVRSLGGQALDFVERIGDTKVKAKVMTNLDRILTGAVSREVLGLTLVDGILHAEYPAEEVRKGLGRIVDDLATKQIKVKDIYDRPDQLKYVRGLGSSDLPDQKKKLKAPVPLEELQLGKKPRAPKPTPTPKPRPKPTAKPRTTVVPATCTLNPTQPRLNALYNELLQLDVSTYPNAAAVAMRVFLELSVDHYIDQRPALKALPAKSTRTLADKLKVVADDLERSGKISASLKNVVYRIAGAGGSVVSASTNTFNQYVHNYYAFAKPQEIYLSWDELQPFMEAL
jgi:hypothetical protein